MNARRTSVIVLTSTSVLFLAGCVASPGTQVVDDKLSEGHEVRYEVVAAPGSKITYGSGEAMKVDYTGATGKWISTAEVVGWENLRIDVTAKAGAESGGTLSCKIAVDARVAGMNTSDASMSQQISCLGSTEM